MLAALLCRQDQSTGLQVSWLDGVFENVLCDLIFVKPFHAC